MGKVVVLMMAATAHELALLQIVQAVRFLQTLAVC